MNPGDRVRNQPVVTDQPTAADCLAHCRSRMAPDDYDLAVLMIQLYATLQRSEQVEKDHQAWQASIDRVFSAPITAAEVSGGKST